MFILGLLELFVNTVPFMKDQKYCLPKIIQIAHINQHLLAMFTKYSFAHANILS